MSTTESTPRPELVIPIEISGTELPPVAPAPEERPLRDDLTRVPDAEGVGSMISASDIERGLAGIDLDNPVPEGASITEQQEHEMFVFREKRVFAAGKVMEGADLKITHQSLCASAGDTIHNLAVNKLMKKLGLDSPDDIPPKKLKQYVKAAEDKLLEELKGITELGSGEGRGVKAAVRSAATRATEKIPSVSDVVKKSKERMPSGIKEKLVSVKERFSLTFRQTRASYNHLVKMNREVASTDPGSDERKDALTARREARADFGIRVAKTFGVVAVAEVVADTVLSRDLSMDYKRAIATGAVVVGGVVGIEAVRMRREEKKLLGAASDEARELMVAKQQEIKDYKASKPEGYDLESDDEYKRLKGQYEKGIELFREKYGTASLSEKAKDGYGNFGRAAYARVQNGITRSIDVAQRFFREDKDLDLGLIEESENTRRNELIDKMESFETDPESDEYKNAVAEFEQNEDELYEKYGERKFTRRGKIAIAAGAVALTAVGAFYLSQRGFHSPFGHSGNSKGKTGVADQTPQTGSGKGSSVAEHTSGSTGRGNGGSGSAAVPAGGGKSGSADKITITVKNPQNPKQSRTVPIEFPKGTTAEEKKLITNGTRQAVGIHYNTPAGVPGTPEYEQMLRDNFKLAAELRG